MEQSRFDLEDEPRAVAEADALAELRRLVVGPERAQIERLQERLDKAMVRAEDVSRVLPEAIIVRARQDGDLASALSSSISQAIKTSIKKDPQPLVDAMFPVMGPAIRKAITDALARMMQSLNQTIEYSFSVKSLKWRLEAWRTGKPFAEVLLIHTLLYRVEQVFLIHRKTGLLLLHLIADSVQVKDGDMVSGMLVAIQDFASDSFAETKDETMDGLSIGERTLLVARGPLAVVAAVVWGIPHPDLKSKLQEACERIHREQGASLESFQGDTSTFELSRPVLEDCLVQARHEPAAPPASPRKSNRPRARWVVVGSIIAALLFVWLFHTIRQRRAFAAYVGELKAQPGIVIISTGRDGGKYTISGLRDPLASDPEEILGHFPQLAKAQVSADFEPYQSLSPRFVLSRAERSLNPPATATLSISNGVLSGHGKAPAGWIAEARKLAPTFPGIASFDAGDLAAIDVPIPDAQSTLVASIRAVLRPPPTIQMTIAGDNLFLTGSASHAWIATSRAMSASLPGGLKYVADAVSDTDLADLISRRDALENGPVIRFNDFFGVEPAPDQEKPLDAVTDDIKHVIACAEAAQVHLRVDVIGHTDSLGIDETRSQVSQQRAQRVADLLVLRGVPRDALVPMGVGDRSPIADGGSDDPRNRRVTFRIEFIAGR